MNSSREHLKISADKKLLSSSCSSKKNEISMGRKKPTAVGGKTSRQEHSNKSKVSTGEPRKKVTSTSSRKEDPLTMHPERREKEGGFKNIKRKVIGSTVNDKENGREIASSKKEINFSHTLKPKGMNVSTPRDNTSSACSKGEFQKTEGDEKSRSMKKSDLQLRAMPKPEPKRRSVCLQDFEVGKKLGKGRFGDVFLVKEKQIGLIMAMKVISKKELKESQMENQLLFEIKIQTFLNHPNTLKMYGCFSDAKNVYLLLELASSGCLFRQLKSKNCFREDQAAYYLRQIITALKCLHGHSIMHRDIKPENILNSFGVLKLCDFGWAVYSPLQYHPSQLSQRQTFCGTLDYVPPEIVVGEFYDEKVDIWCIGILCYELCTGHAPFEAKENELETYDKILSLDLQFPTNLSQDVVDFISRLLTKDPRQRMTFEQIESHPWMRKHENESGRLISKEIWEVWHSLKS